MYIIIMVYFHSFIIPRCLRISANGINYYYGYRFGATRILAKGTFWEVMHTNGYKILVECPPPPPS